ILLLHSFPTRRSSDLTRDMVHEPIRQHNIAVVCASSVVVNLRVARYSHASRKSWHADLHVVCRSDCVLCYRHAVGSSRRTCRKRSEEHTSELQSRENL